MPRKKSLSRGDFARVARAAFRREHGNLFSLSYGTIDAAGESTKASCVVSKKVAARAVDRNLIKRRCRAVVSGALQGGNKPQTMIFYAKKSVRGAAFAEIKKEILLLISRATLRN